MKKLTTIFIVLAILVVGVSASVLSYFGSITEDVNVEQAVTLEGQTELEVSSVGSGVFLSEPYTVKNNANVPLSVSLSSTEVDGITTEYTTSARTLVLENKDQDWNAVDDDTHAELTFDGKGLTFDYMLSGEGLESETQYSLIYYADEDDRFVNWGSVNQGALLGVGTTDSEGNLKMSASVGLESDLPMSGDANSEESGLYDYCESDGYEHCFGAKIWLVPSETYDEESHSLLSWSPDRFLFETDMVEYEFAESEDLSQLDLDAQEDFSFYLKNKFSPSFSGQETITTLVEPLD